MSQFFRSLFLFFAVFGSYCHQAPASGRQLEVGTVYTFDYVLSVELNEPPPLTFTSSDKKQGSTVGYKVLSQVKVTPVWQSEQDGSILEIQLLKPQLQIKSRKTPTPEGFFDHTSNLDSAKLHPLYVHWKEGTVYKTYSTDEDDISLVNIKKGIANLFQFQIGKESTIENTPRGSCNVTYTKSDQSHITKFIDSDCTLPPGDVHTNKYSKLTHISPVLGSTTKGSVQVNFTLSSNFVEEVTAEEVQTVRVNAKQEVGAIITGIQHLKQTDASKEDAPSVNAGTVETAILDIGKVKSLTLTPDSIVPYPERIPICEVTNCKALDTLLATLTPENMVTSKLASAFIQLVDRFRLSTTPEIEKILKKSKPEVLPQLLDVCAAAGTLHAHKAAMKYINLKNTNKIADAERYFLGLSLSTSPDAKIIPDIFTLVKKGVESENLQETLILSLAALVHTVRIQRSSLTYGQDVEAFLLESLEKCPAEKPECAQLYLRSLKNLKSQSTVGRLFEMVTKSESRVGVVAMKALHALPYTFFDPIIHRPLLIQIINQLGKKHDSSTRTLAIDILLRHQPSKAEIHNVLATQLKSTDREHAEVGTFLWNRLHEFSTTNPNLKTWVEEIIREEGLHTYHHLSPRGLSMSFSRTFASGPSGNSTFSNAIEMTGKILKRSSFDVYLHSQDSFIHPLSLGIFAGGLSSFTSSENNAAETDEDAIHEEPTAGMELSVMGVQMRPIVFFTGKGELMGLVWSGAGSEKTTALQGNVLLQNEGLVIPMFNGLVADVHIYGGLSFDLSGQISVSLWHRTADSLVQTQAAIVLQSVVRLDTSFVRSRVDYTVASEATLDFTSNINFSEGVLMCLKLTQPEFNIKQNIHKTERVPGSKHRLRKAKYNTIPIAGITYALNKKNSELCGIMHKDEL